MRNKCMSKRLLSIVLIGTLAIPNMTYAAELVQKDETVYVTLNQQGEVKERIVSDWIHSNEKNIEIRDKSILKDIKNVKGEEKPNGIGENLIWKVEGNDIYYKGTTDKKLPIDINVKYLLDGKEIKPEDLAGKSGEVKIKVDYKNNESHIVNIKGKDRKIYTLFSTITIVNLPIDNFKNVKISGGKMISDGNNQIVTFICLPGMKESLDLKDSTLELKENLEITAQVENFEMGPIMITGTPELPDMEEFKSASSLKELINGINDIQDASTKLAEGTGELSAGQKTLAENMALFTGGISKLEDGLKAFATGTTKFGSGAEQFGLGTLDFATNSKAFADGAVKVADGADKLVTGSKGLSDGATKLSEGTNTVSAKMETLSQGLDTMVTSTEKLQQGQKQVIDGTEQSLKGIDKLKKGKELEIKSTGALIVGIETLQGIVNLLGKIPGTGEIAENLSKGLENEKAGLTALKDGGNEFLQGLNELEQGIVKIKAGSEQVNTGMGQLQEGQKNAAAGSSELAKATKQISDKTGELAKGAGQLAQGGAQLSPAAESLKIGSQGLSGGANKLNTAAKDLSAGTKVMGESTQKLVVGAQSMGDGSTKLKEGADKLASGSKELDENMKKFDKEGIQKISSEIDSKMGSLEDIIDVKDELVKISNNYGTFSGVGDNMDGKVKFVMKTDEIKVKIAEVKEETETVKEEKKGFFGWLKNLFSNNTQARK